LPSLSATSNFRTGWVPRIHINSVESNSRIDESGAVRFVHSPFIQKRPFDDRKGEDENGMHEQGNEHVDKDLPDADPSPNEV
jgi:hypothetical protein